MTTFQKEGSMELEITSMQNQAVPQINFDKTAYESWKL
jgi:hypothetical protein